MLNTALQMAKLCQTAYFDNIEWRHEAFSVEKFKPVYFNAEAYLLDHGEYQVLLFIGTDQSKEWLSNIDVRKERGVHQGFYDALEEMWFDIVRAIDKSKPLYITGHSRGAALAVLATDRLCNGYFNIAETYLFGCPRVMGYTRSLGYPKNQTYRFVNNNDIVCRVPSALRFKHVGKMLYIDRDKKIWGTGGAIIDLWERVKDRFNGRLERRLDGIKDHYMPEYIDGIARNL